MVTPAQTSTVLALPGPTEIVGTLWAKSPRSGSEKTWPIKGSDVLWLGRMLVAEDGRYANPEEGYAAGRAMVSMILRRLAVSFFGGPFTSVEHLLRGDPSGGNPKGWSEPIRYYGILHGDPAKVPLYRAAQARSWADVPAYYQRAILDTVSGRVPLAAPHVVDAAAGAFTAARLADPNVGGAAGWRREFAGTRSWLISTTLSRAWPEANVGTRVGGSVSGVGGAILGLVVLVGAAFLYSHFRV